MLEGTKFDDPNSLFNPAVIKNRDYYETKLLKEQEDNDAFGN